MAPTKHDVSYGSTWKRPFSLYKDKALIHFASVLGRVGLLGGYPRNCTFIVGCSRSGTTILNRLIAMHPDVAMYSEGLEVWDPREVEKDIDHYKDEGDVSEADSNRIRWCFATCQRFRRKEFFLNKNPHNSVRIRYVKSIFPQAKIIHIVRDGRAVVNSMIQRIALEPYRKEYLLGGFSRPRNFREISKFPKVERHSWQWTSIIEEVNAQKARLSQLEFLELKYEDLLNEPEEVMRLVYEFMGLPGAERAATGAVEQVGGPGFRWRECFTEQDLDVMNNIMGSWLEAYGYEI